MEFMKENTPRALATSWWRFLRSGAFGSVDFIALTAQSALCYDYFMDKARKVAKQFKTAIKIYRLVLKDKRTPLLGKLLLGFAIGYFFLPFDIIPDFIPVLGQLDDLIIVPLLVILALKLIPSDLVQEHRDSIK